MLEGTWIGFDFGLRRIGVATGQGITRSAAPLTTLFAKNGTPHWKEIHDLIREWSPCGLVVGMPYRLDLTDQPITIAARQFVEELKKETGLPVHIVDERLTTLAARERVYENRSHTKRKAYEPVDDISAAVILEAFFANF